MKTYTLSIAGCDATSECKIDLTEEEVALLRKLEIITRDIRDTEDCHCFPVLSLDDEPREGAEYYDLRDDVFFEKKRKEYEIEDAKCIRCQGSGIVITAVGLDRVEKKCPECKGWGSFT